MVGPTLDLWPFAQIPSAGVTIPKWNLCPILYSIATHSRRFWSATLHTYQNFVVARSNFYFLSLIHLPPRPVPTNHQITYYSLGFNSFVLINLHSLVLKFYALCCLAATNVLLSILPHNVRLLNLLLFIKRPLFYLRVIGSNTFTPVSLLALILIYLVAGQNQRSCQEDVFRWA